MTTIKHLRKKIIKLVNEEDPIYAAAYMTEAVKFCNCILYFREHNDPDDNEFASQIREAIIADITRSHGVGEVRESKLSHPNFGVAENIDHVRPPYFGKRGPTR